MAFSFLITIDVLACLVIVDMTSLIRIQMKNLILVLVVLTPLCLNDFQHEKQNVPFPIAAARARGNVTKKKKCFTRIYIIYAKVKLICTENNF